jgi:chondroitin AC lyase
MTHHVFASGRRRFGIDLLGCGATWTSLASLSPPAAAATSAADAVALDRIRQRLRDDFLSSINTGDAPAWVAKQSSDGSWPDIDYADQSRGIWKPAAHLERTRGIAVGYAKSGHALFKAPAAKAAVVASLRAWLARKPTSSNWWQNSIGPQLALMPVLVLMADALPKDLLSSASALLHDPTMVPPGQATGQNLVWYATQQVVRGALRGEPADVAQASQRLQAEVAITQREGIQVDHSFHQHGPQLYTGTYGLGLLMDSVRMARLLAETPWAYNSERLQLLSDYALEGVRPLVRGRWLDWGARGREFTRVPNKLSRPQALLPALRDLGTLAPAQRSALAALADHVDKGTTGAPVVGNWHYWRSDFMVHQTAAGYCSVRMVSSRTVGTESGNGENLRGYWLPFGMTYLLRRGDEYDGLPPVWDWSRLPGVTAPDEVPAFNGLQRHESRFVGAVSDGRSGLAAMRLNKLDTTARKAWFLHGDLMVALGTDIRSTRGALVSTTLNQTRWLTDVVTNKRTLPKGNQDLQLSSDTTWVWQDGITYLLPGGGDNTSLQLREQNGSGRDINTELGGGDSRAKVMTLAINHGLKPTNGSYAYGVWMGAATAADAGRSPAYKVLQNTAKQQSVLHPTSGTVQCVLHEPGVMTLDDTYNLQTDQPCLLQAVPVETGWQVSVSDPSTVLRNITLRLLSSGKVVAQVDLALSPGAAEGGRTKQVRVDKPR